MMMVIMIMVIMVIMVMVIRKLIHMMIIDHQCEPTSKVDRVE